MHQSHMKLVAVFKIKNILIFYRNKQTFPGGRAELFLMTIGRFKSNYALTYLQHLSAGAVNENGDLVFNGAFQGPECRLGRHR